MTFGPFEKLASSLLRSSAGAPPSPFHSGAASPHKPVGVKDVFYSSALSALNSVANLTNLADGSFVLVKILPELLELQVSFPQLLLQLPDYRLVAFHGWR